LSEYKLQIYQSTLSPIYQIDWIMMDELPFQPLILERLAALGFIEIQQKMIPTNQIDRIAKILRLRQSLGVNLTGAAIICELLDRLEEKENEIEQISK